LLVISIRKPMPSAGFEPSIPATKRLQTYALNCTATGIDRVHWLTYLLACSMEHRPLWKSNRFFS